MNRVALYHTSFTILRKDGLNTFFSVIRTGDTKHLTQRSTTHSSQNANNANVHQLVNGETKGDIPYNGVPFSVKMNESPIPATVQMNLEKRYAE